MKRNIKNKASRNPLRVAITTASFGLAVALASPPATADVVTDWNAHTTQILTQPLTAADERPLFGVHWALVHIAIYDAVNSIDLSYRPFMVRPEPLARGASQEAAAASAAYHLLVKIFPSRTATLDGWYAASLATVADGWRKTRGIAIGKNVAEKVLANRAADGRNAVVTYTFGTGPGAYQATPGAPPTAPVTPWLAKVTPFVMKSPSQFRSDGPPPLTSAHYAADLNETKQMGAKDSPYRTAEQTQIAKFHTMNPNLLWGNALNRFTRDLGLTVPENARLMAQLFVSAADAVIGCWDGKFHFNAWRPVTAIVNADQDDNLATSADPAWVPQEVTPPHQEYPAGHGCATGSITEAMSLYFGTPNMPLSITSTATNTTRTYNSAKALRNEVIDARVFGGMHFRYATEDGQELGKQVARLVAHRHFQPLFPWLD
jgi:PAP2 superfamily